MNWIPVIINPAAGRDKAVLAGINQVFRTAGIRWSIEITQAEGDGIDLARQLAGRGAQIVAVYGGDGTVSEVATGLAGTQAALGLLPGGTGNVLARETGIPSDRAAAAQLLVSAHKVRLIDMGAIGKRKFLLRAGVGLEAAAIERTPRELKDRFGLLAYGIGTLQALSESRPLRYLLDLDGQKTETQGVVCTVANSGHLGLPGLRLSPQVDMEDGILDVIVLRRVDLKFILQFISGRVARSPSMGELQHWQVRRASIQVDPPQNVQVDRDFLGTTPAEIHCLPRSLRIVAPK